MLRKILKIFQSKCCLVRHRYKQCLFFSLCVAVFNLVDHCEWQALDKMVIEDERPTRPYMPGSYTCPYRSTFHSHSKQHAQYYWSHNMMQGVRTIYQFASLFSLVPAGVVSDRHGGRRVLTTGLVLSSAISSLLPLSTLISYNVFLVLVVLRRFCSGLSIPAATALVAEWALPTERTVFMAAVISGNQLGRIAGEVLSIHVLYWDTLLYTCAGVTLVSALFWHTLSRCRCASSTNDLQVVGYKQGKETLPPWLYILSSSYALILCILKLANYLWWTTKFLLVYYLENVIFFKFPNKLQIMYLGLAQYTLDIAAVIGFMGSGLVSDYLISSELLSLQAVRRLFIFLSCVLPVGALVALTLSECHRILASTCFITISYLWSLGQPTIYVTPVDFCPSRAATLMAIMLVTAGLIGQVITELVLFWFVESEIGNIIVWRYLFITVSVFIISASVPYLVWAPTEQSWKERRSPSYQSRTAQVRET